MLYMNDYDRLAAARFFGTGRTPNRAYIVTVVDNLARWADCHSDGWAYWPKPVRAAERAGPKLTSDSLVKALEDHPYPRGFLGNPEFTFGPQKRLGNDQTRLAQIQGGRWKTVSDFLR